MTPLAVAIVDDEVLARHRLRRLLQKVGGNRIDIVLECVDAEELLASVSGVEVDVLFLDIEMPGGDAFEILRRWQGRKPDVVFVTAYESYGVRAFDARVVDYLLKPVTAERLRDTIARLLERVEPQEQASVQAQGDRIALQVGLRTYLVAPGAIDAVVAQGNYVEVHAGGDSYAIRRPLASFERELDASVFVRLHRSVIVRSAAIRSIRSAGSGRYRVELHGGRCYVSGRSYRRQVLRLLG